MLASLATLLILVADKGPYSPIPLSAHGAFPLSSLSGLSREANVVATYNLIVMEEEVEVLVGTSGGRREMMAGGSWNVNGWARD